MGNGRFKLNVEKPIAVVITILWKYSLYGAVMGTVIICKHMIKAQSERILKDIIDNFRHRVFLRCKAAPANHSNRVNDCTRIEYIKKNCADLSQKH